MTRDVMLIQGDARHLPLADESVQCCVTSPPYFGLRDYGVAGQIGLESTPDEYVATMVEVFREVRRVLKVDGVAWLNLGDSYTGSASMGGIGKETDYTGKRILPTKTGNGLKPKDLIGIPWLVAFALRADGWYLRQDIIWHKPNPMPESVTDRCTKAHEYIFLLSKSDRYFYDGEAVKEPLAAPEKNGYSSTISLRYHEESGRGGNKGLLNKEARFDRNKRSVWSVAPSPFTGAHFATFPPDLIKPCIKAGSRPGDVVLDPFNGSGTTAEVSRELGRRYVGIELKAEYIELTKRRLAQGVLFGPSA